MSIFIGGSAGLVEGVFTREDNTIVPYKKGYVILKEGNRTPELHTLDETVYNKYYNKLKFGHEYMVTYRKYYDKYKIEGFEEIEAK